MKIWELDDYLRTESKVSYYVHANALCDQIIESTEDPNKKKTQHEMNQAVDKAWENYLDSLIAKYTAEIDQDPAYTQNDWIRYFDEHGVLRQLENENYNMNILWN